MAVALRAARRWILTGTPTPSTPTSQVAHLFPLLSFLHEPIYGRQQGVWERAVQKPFEAGRPEGRQRLVQVLTRCMFLGQKKDVLSIPPCARKVKLLSFSPQHAASYNEFVETVQRNLLLADWMDPSHEEEGREGVCLCVVGEPDYHLFVRGWAARSGIWGGRQQPTPGGPSSPPRLTLFSPFIPHSSPPFPLRPSRSMQREWHLEWQATASTKVDYLLSQLRLLAPPPPPPSPASTPFYPTADPPPVAPQSADPHLPPHSVQSPLAAAQTRIVSHAVTSPPPVHALDEPMAGCPGSLLRSPKGDCNTAGQREEAEDGCAMEADAPVAAAGGYGGERGGNGGERGGNGGERGGNGGEKGVNGGGKGGYGYERWGYGGGKGGYGGERWGYGGGKGGYGGEKAIVFTQFLEHIALLEAQLTLAGVNFAGLYSPRPQSVKMQELLRFQHDPACRVLLMDGTGSLGLDLSFVSRVFLMEPVWDPSVEEQMVSRAHRMGASRPITVETLAMAGTLEEHMLQILQVDLVHVARPHRQLLSYPSNPLLCLSSPFHCPGSSPNPQRLPDSGAQAKQRQAREAVARNAILLALKLVRTADSSLPLSPSNTTSPAKPLSSPHPVSPTKLLSSSLSLQLSPFNTTSPPNLLSSFHAFSPAKPLSSAHPLGSPTPLSSCQFLTRSNLSPSPSLSLSATSLQPPASPSPLNASLSPTGQSAVNGCCLDAGQHKSMFGPGTCEGGTAAEGAFETGGGGTAGATSEAAGTSMVPLLGAATAGGAARASEAGAGGVVGAVAAHTSHASAACGRGERESGAFAGQAGWGSSAREHGGTREEGHAKEGGHLEKEQHSEGGKERDGCQTKERGGIAATELREGSIEAAAEEGAEGKGNGRRRVVRFADEGMQPELLARVLRPAAE
ncbi:unnamed protein product [Closterium sp. NIES-54]